MADLADYEWLVGTDADVLLQQLISDRSTPLQQMSRLRKSLSVERTRLIVQQAELRCRAVEKFGEHARSMFFTEVGLQQATDLLIARYKASRLPDNASICDYCCGIGGDLISFAQRGTAVGWDAKAEIVTLANANLKATGAASGQAKVGMVEEHPPDRDQVWHLDPDRRVDGRRSTQLQWHSPGPEVIEEWRSISPEGLIKIAPASEVPSHWDADAEREWISRDRQCRQQIVWFGSLATHPGQRRATRISRDADGKPVANSFVGTPADTAELVDVASQYVYDTDPAIRAARLSSAFAKEQGLQMLGLRQSYLTSNVPVEHPLLARFRLLEQMPLRPKEVSKQLRRMKVGTVEIKKRGVQVTPEHFRKQLKLEGEQKATLLLTKVGNRELAMICEREVGVG